MSCLAPTPAARAQPAKCLLAGLRKRRGMVEIIISMVQSTVYKFLYLTKNKIIHLVHRAQFYELCGVREHFVASYHKIQTTTTVQIIFSFHLKHTDFQKLPFSSEGLSAQPLAASSKDFCPSCFHTYICIVTGLLQQAKLKHKLGAQGRSERSARAACLFNTLLLATQIRFATAPLSVPEAAEGLFPLWSSQFSLAQRQFIPGKDSPFLNKAPLQLNPGRSTAWAAAHCNAQNTARSPSCINLLLQSITAFCYSERSQPCDSHN